MERLSTTGAPGARYTAVIVGSGYGGAIAASRIARAQPPAGQPKPTVCVLERGREWALDEFPDTSKEALEAMQADLPAKHVGSPLGLFDFRVNDEINVLVGCGLGGTSLINANVSIAPDRRVFSDPRWPAKIREEFGAGDTPLTRGYDRAMAMLRPVSYPDAPEYAPLRKLQALEEAARKIEQPNFYRPQINVNFEDQTNHVGVFQPACNRCGDCVSGCKHGSKNTVAMNYLPDARNHGAEIFTEVAVRFVEREENGWTVHYDLVGRGRSRFGAPSMFVRADIVILAAGSLGSTEILLRSRARGLKTSARLGHGFTGNGDVLGFGYNNDSEINGVGYGTEKPDPRAPTGPCITGIIDARDTPALDDGVVIEEGSIPGALATLMPKMLAITAGLVGKDTDTGVGDLLRERLREAESLIRGPRTGAVRNTQTYLVMAHDSADGKMRLENDRLRISWKGVGTQPIFKKINDKLTQCTGAHGGTYVKNPSWSKLTGHDLVTVHPLGGCPMGEDATTGVVNHAGQVYKEGAGSGVHEGLYVTDGAVIPRSLGVNPLLTISALAERSCELLAAARGWTLDLTLRAPVAGAPPVRVERRRAGVRFTETMRGEFFADVAQPLPEVLRERMGAGTPLEFTLTVSIPDVEAMAKDPSHHGRLDGTVTAPALSADPLTVVNGDFHLFERLASDPPDTRRMVYRFEMVSEEGQAYLFDGHKLVHDDPGADMWADLTTLFVSIRRIAQDGQPADVVGCALLRIEIVDFARQMSTMTVTNARDRKQQLATLAAFGKFFSGVVFETYGPFSPTQIVETDAPIRKERSLRAPDPELHFFTTDDGVRLRLTRYRGGGKGPVLLAHGLGVSSRIFSIDTIDTNVVEYLVANGYDVWLLDYRASIALPAARQQFSGDEIAKYDYPRAVAEVRRLTGARTVQLLAHCFGASTVTMSLLAGLRDVRSVVLSQVSLDVVSPPLTRVKTGLYLPNVLDAFGIRSLDAIADEGEGWAGRVYDKLLLAQPVAGEEKCRSATCHRITFMYAPLYEHDQLNDATHDVLHEMFGEANMRSFKHLGAICRAGKLVDASGADVYAPRLDRLDLPITFIHGEENACFLPESTRRTYETLRAKFDRRKYRRHEIPGYGHIDCMFGRNAARDVYPYIVESLDAHPA